MIHSFNWTYPWSTITFFIREFAKATGGLCKPPMAGFRLRFSMALYFLVVPVPLNQSYTSFSYNLRSMAKQVQSIFQVQYPHTSPRKAASLLYWSNQGLTWNCETRWLPGSTMMYASIYSVDAFPLLRSKFTLVRLYCSLMCFLNFLPICIKYILYVFLDSCSLCLRSIFLSLK